MYNNKRIVIVTPAGRKRYLNILKKYIFASKIVDEWKIWQNTLNLEDINYIKEISLEDKRVVVENRPLPLGTSYCIHKFFNNCIENNTVYIRFDDDIIWMKDDAIENLAKFRIENPKYFLVYGNIVNNSICDHLHQRCNDIYHAFPITYNCMDHNAWKNVILAERKHKILIENIKKNNFKGYNILNWTLHDYERVSINVISWLGEEFKKFNGVVGVDEEAWLSCVKPQELQKKSCICGNALFAHFAFYTQRHHLDQTNLIEIYEDISSCKKHASPIKKLF